MKDIRIKRAYEAPVAADGARILVDRLWPRALDRRKAAIDRWFKEIAPSNELRRWFGHRPERWPEFRRRYLTELRQQPELLKELQGLAATSPVTLLFAARDTERNNAVVLREVLQQG